MLTLGLEVERNASPSCRNSKTNLHYFRIKVVKIVSVTHLVIINNGIFRLGARINAKKSGSISTVPLSCAAQFSLVDSSEDVDQPRIKSGSHKSISMY